MEAVHHQRSEKRKAQKEKKFTCSTCNTQFTEKQNLKRHLKNIHNIDLLEIEKVHKSDEQQQQQQQQSTKKDEMRRQKEESVAEKVKSNKKDKKTVKIVPFDLTLHENNNRFHCSICNRPFVTSENRNRHFVQTHQTEKQFQCQNCSKRFLTAVNKYKHEQYCQTAIASSSSTTLAQTNSKSSYPKPATSVPTSIPSIVNDDPEIDMHNLNNELDPFISLSSLTSPMVMSPSMVRIDSIEPSSNTRDVQETRHDFDPFISLPSQTSPVPMSPSMVRLDDIIPSLNTQDVQDIEDDFDPFTLFFSQTSSIPMSPSMVRIDDNIVPSPSNTVNVDNENNDNDSYVLSLSQISTPPSSPTSNVDNENNDNDSYVLSLSQISTPPSSPTSTQIGGGFARSRDEETSDTGNNDFIDGDMQHHRTGLNGVFHIYRKHFSPSSLNLMDRLQDGVNEVQHQLRLQQETNKAYKIYMTVQASFYKASNVEQITSPHPTFNSDVAIILPTTTLSPIVKTLHDNIIHQIDTYENNGSGWVIYHLIYLDLHIVQFDPLRASSYLPVPKKFVNKKGYVNIQNDDQKCFLWCVLAHLHPVQHKHADRVSKYRQYENEVNMQDIEYPVKLRDIDQFENQNPDISVSVFGLSNDDFNLSPIRITDAI